MIIRVFLGFQAFMLISYGLYCLADPGILADSAGISAAGITGNIELRAMYGGLQCAVGVLCLLGIFQRRFQGIALVTLLFIFAGLAVPRITLGLMYQDFSGYNSFAMLYEGATVAFLCGYWRRAGTLLTS